MRELEMLRALGALVTATFQIGVGIHILKQHK